MTNAVSEHYADYVRSLYRSGRPNWFARAQNRVGAWVAGAGLWPNWFATLEVVGRRTGRVSSFPVVIANYEGEQYLVSMLGEKANWVQNVRADAGRAVLRHGIREAVRLQEVDVAARPPILRRYLEAAPGARPHIPVDRHAELSAFAAIAARYPVFRIVHRGQTQR